MKCPGCKSRWVEDVTTEFDDEDWFKCARCAIRFPRPRIEERMDPARGFLFGVLISSVVWAVLVRWVW